MAYFRKRDNGWEYRISYKSPDGRYRQKSKGGFRSKTEAKIAAAQADLDLSNNIIEDKQITLTDYFANWSTIHKKPQVDPTTFDKYIFTLNIIKKHFKDTKLVSITPTTYQQVINILADKYVKTTIKLFNAHIRQSLKVALHEGTLKKDFTTLVKIHSNVQSKSTDLKFLELNEYQQLLTEVRQSIHYQSHFFIYLIAKTGLRFSEAQGLTLDSIDYENLSLDISRTYKVFGKDKGWKATKNPQSVRSVPFDTELLTALQEYLKDGYTDNPEKRLFTSVSNTAVNKILKKKLEKDFSAHGLRHTYVSYLIYNDISAVAIAKLIGHKDATETLKTYTHLFSQKQKEDHKKIRDLFKNLGQI